MLIAVNCLVTEATWNTDCGVIGTPSSRLALTVAALEHGRPAAAHADAAAGRVRRLPPREQPIDARLDGRGVRL